MHLKTYTENGRKVEEEKHEMQIVFKRSADLLYGKECSKLSNENLNQEVFWQNEKHQINNSLLKILLLVTLLQAVNSKEKRPHVD